MAQQSIAQPLQLRTKSIDAIFALDGALRTEPAFAAATLISPQVRRPSAGKLTHSGAVKTRGLQPRTRPTSPPARALPPQTPPPLPPWPSWVQKTPLPPVPHPCTAPVAWSAGQPDCLPLVSPLVPRRVPVPSGMMQPYPAPAARPILPIVQARTPLPRPDYGYTWRMGPYRPVKDNYVAGMCVFETVDSGDAALLHALIEQVPNVLLKTDPEHARTPLAWAVLRQRLDMVRMLVSAMHAYGGDKHGEMDAFGLDCRTPLLLAIDGQTADAVHIVDTLLAAGASIYVRTPRIANAWGRFFLYSSARPDETQDAAEYAVRRRRPLILHQILKWDEQAPFGARPTAPRVDLGALAHDLSAQNALDAQDAQTEQVQTILHAARRRRGQPMPVRGAQNLDAPMARLDFGAPRAAHTTVRGWFRKSLGPLRDAGR